MLARRRSRRCGSHCTLPGRRAGAAGPEHPNSARFADSRICAPDLPVRQVSALNSAIGGLAAITGEEHAREGGTRPGRSPRVPVRNKTAPVAGGASSRASGAGRAIAMRYIAPRPKLWFEAGAPRRCSKTSVAQGSFRSFQYSAAGDGKLTAAELEAELTRVLASRRLGQGPLASAVRIRGRSPGQHPDHRRIALDQPRDKILA
jgi:hypothetical protein